MISTARSESGCWITRRFLTRFSGTSKRGLLAVEIEQFVAVRGQQFRPSAAW